MTEGGTSREACNAAWREHFARLSLWRGTVRDRPVLWGEDVSIFQTWPRSGAMCDVEWEEALQQAAEIPRVSAAGRGLDDTSWERFGRNVGIDSDEAFPGRIWQGVWAAACSSLEQLNLQSWWGRGQPYLPINLGDYVRQASLWEAVLPGDARNPYWPLLTVLQEGALVWVTPEAVVCVAYPTQTREDAEGRLHADDGPALVWGRFLYYFWHGVLVPPEVVVSPERITADRILEERNLSVREAMLERAGVARLLERGERVSHDRRGTLWRVRSLREEAPISIVEVTDPSTGRLYHLRVPPWVSTAQEAVAWGFGFDRVADYGPLQET